MLEKDLECIRRERSELKDKLGKEKAYADKSYERIKAAERKAEELECQLKEVKDELAKANGSLAEARQLAVKASTEKKDLSKALAAARTAEQSAKKEVDELAAAVSKVSDEPTKAQDEVKNLEETERDRRVHFMTQARALSKAAQQVAGAFRELREDLG